MERFSTDLKVVGFKPTLIALARETLERGCPAAATFCYGLMSFWNRKGLSKVIGYRDSHSYVASLLLSCCFLHHFLNIRFMPY